MDSSAPTLPEQTFFLLGPTAVGKSELAVQLAEQVGGEIVGADAFQIYEGLDLLSAKPDAELRARIPHHLIGDVPLDQAFDVATYRARALQSIADIVHRGKVPIVCGGAGLYVRALTHGLSEALPTADAGMRARLESHSLDALVTQLHQLDPATTVDEKNRRRVVRALEVCMLTGKPFSSFRQEWDDAPMVHGAILTRPREELLARIEKRTEAMFAKGVIAEVGAAKSVGSTAAQMLGLREIRSHIAGDLSLSSCKSAINIATRQYAKRQLTWFRRERGYQWLDLSVESEALKRLSLMATVIC